MTIILLQEAVTMRTRIFTAFTLQNIQITSEIELIKIHDEKWQ